MAVLAALTLAALTAALVVVGAAVRFVWQLLVGIGAAHAADDTD